MAYGESNCHVTDDVKQPRKVKLVTPWYAYSPISKTAGDRDPLKDHQLLTENDLWGIKWSRDRWRHVTPKGRSRDPSYAYAITQKASVIITVW